MRMTQGAGRTEAETVSDAVAVERTPAGEREAYRVLVERHSWHVFRLAYRMTGNRHDAEEVVQEAFLRAYQKLRQFAGNANLRTWVYRIAANYAIDRMRQRSGEESHRQLPSRPVEQGLTVDPITIVPDPAPSPERLAGSAQLGARMQEALATLTPAERTAIVMRHWEGCAIEEIARALKSNPNATKNTVFRAVAKLRKVLVLYGKSPCRECYGNRIMKHPTETELIAYRDGDPRERTAIAAHLHECPECREELEQIEAVYTALDAVPVLDPGEDFEQRVWQQLSPQLGEKQPRWWEGLFQAGRLAVIGAVAALVVLAFFLGRRSSYIAPVSEIADAGKVRERVLLVAVGDHLGRSGMILVELANTEPEKGQKVIDISSEQKRAQDLVEENRLYRQTALREGDTAMASTLEELERVLLDIANSLDEVTPAQFAVLQKRIESRGILFKVRVVHQGVQEKEKATTPSPAEQNSGPKERNKA